MRKMVKYNELTKNQKIFRIINLVITALMFLACVGLIIYYALGNDPDGKRVMSTVVILVACVIPLLLEYIFRFRFNSVVFLGYEVYLAIAGLFGSAANGYGLIPWFDTPVHVLMGYIVCMFGLFIIARLGDYKKLSPWLVIVFCVCFSLGVEVVWELSEWIIDRLFGSTMQGEICQEFGHGLPHLWDTIKDMFCNFGGAMIFFLHFVIGKFTKCHLGIPAIETELTTRKIKGKDSSEIESKEVGEIEDKTEE